MPFLIQDGIDGCGGVGREVGDHDVLRVVIEEEPGLLEAECLREWVAIAHDCSTGSAVRDTTDERFESRPQSMGAVEWCGTVVYRGAGNKVPIPGRSDVLVLIALQVSVECTIGEVKT